MLGYKPSAVHCKLAPEQACSVSGSMRLHGEKRASRLSCFNLQLSAHSMLASVFLHSGGEYVPTMQTDGGHGIWLHGLPSAVWFGQGNLARKSCC